MILDLITNLVIMKGTNIAGGYDIFTGDVDNTNPAMTTLENFILEISGCQQGTDTAT